MDTHNFDDCVVIFRGTCWMLIILLLIYFFPFTFPFQLCVSFWDYISCNTVQFPCNFLFLLCLLLQMLYAFNQPSIFKMLCYFVHLWLLVRFYIQGSYCLAGTSSSCIYAVSMAFYLAGKVVALHLDNSTLKAYLCNKVGTVSHFLSRLAFCIWHMANKQGITLIPAYSPTHLNVEADLYVGKASPRGASPSYIASAAFLQGDQPEVDMLVSSFTNQCHFYYVLERMGVLVCSKGCTKQCHICP